METDFIDDFIEEYRKQPCLWQASSADFKNRKKRQEAYHKLIEVANKHGEHYNIERTKQKINNLRCAFRHQLRKFTESKNKTSGKEDTYCPKRRYFESLMFLLNEERPDKAKVDIKVDAAEMPTKTVDYPLNAEAEESKDTPAEIVIRPQSQTIQGTTVQSVPTSKEEIVFETQPYPSTPKENRLHIEVQANDEVNFLWPRINRPAKPGENNIIHMAASEIVEQDARPSSACSQASSPSTRSENAPKKVKIDCSATDFEKLLNLACSKTSATDTNEDNFSIFGKMVAYKLRSMDAQQCIIAEKLITDILLDGQMKMLTYPARNTIPYRQETGHAFVISGLNINGTTEQPSDRAQYSTQTIQYNAGNGSQI